jgi:uncharacterized protein
VEISQITHLSCKGVYSLNTMLVQFSVGNFRSFKDTVTLDLVATHLESKDKSVDENNTFEAPGGLRLLKSVVLYGANASGKSNLLKALEFMKTFVNDSAKESQAGDPINVEPFLLDSKTEKEPSFFEIVFILDEVRYRYGFEVTTKEVVSEWLYHTPNKKESSLFTRDKQEIKVSRNFNEGQRLQERTRNNALFLSVVGQFNGKLSLRIAWWLSARLNVFTGRQEDSYKYLSKWFMIKEDKYDLKYKIINLVRKLDLGIEDIQLEAQNVSPEKLLRDLLHESNQERLLSRMLSPNNKNIAESMASNREIELVDILTLHRKYSHHKYNKVVAFNLEHHESDGTQKLFALASILTLTLITGGTLTIDEIDARFHPLLTAAIIDLFHSTKDNSSDAQLLFATHDVNLLRNDRFRRDQIWFVEKDKYGASHLYSLAEFKVRNDALYQKDYLAGRYGAIPFIGAQNFLEGLQDGKAQKAR